MDNKAAYFISDLHLGASYIADGRLHEQKVVDFLESISKDCSELYLLGDVLDFWFEYRNVVPKGFVRFFGALASMADRGIKITWIIGNHDIWLFDYLKNEIGMEVADGYVVREIFGKRFMLSHGDAVGKLPLGFRIIRSVFRNRIAIRLASCLHPRWLVGFAHLWSGHSKKSGGYTLRAETAINPYIDFARSYNSSHEQKIDYFLFGHQHVLVSEDIEENNAKVAIIGDWMRLFSYVRFDGVKFEILTYK